ncbi:DUF1344 domain-containing protein [Oricola nitratireducens]|uniref:DUF1344 domain-containing protein n=1 Tax=Oricola nitratireducens TaxID=2775868 RepID=UPI001868410B|nr:DUF1344 domain-containing protein [Oricola nitratireducens]
MKKLVTATLAGAMLVGSVVASLAAVAQGVVANVDTETRTITLEDGSNWVVADNVDLEAIAAGDKIQVTYDDGTTNVTAVEKETM